jgi:pyruvate ferredoxin oxidoreductase beta subunit
MAIARRPEMKKPVEEYLNIQGRYRHFFRPERRDDLLDSIQAGVDLRWEILLEKVGV